MSLENEIKSLTAAVKELTETMKAGGNPTVSQEVPAAPVPPIVAEQPAAPAPTEQPAAPAMPAPPAFTPPAAPTAPAPAAAPAATAPFTDGKGLLAYVMQTYQTIGQEKGAKIADILTALGYKNVNDVKPEHYNEFYAKLEALKS